MIQFVIVEVFMQEKLTNRKKRLISNIIFRIVTLVSIMVMLIFCICLRRLDTISKTLLFIIYISLILTYLILTLLVVPRKFKMSIKVVGATILVVLSFSFVFGIRAINRKIDQDNKAEEVKEEISDNSEENIEEKEESITNE